MRRESRSWFSVSALYTGLAGALSAFIVGFLDPQEFSFFLSIQFITIIILGGSPRCSARCSARAS